MPIARRALTIRRARLACLALLAWCAQPALAQSASACPQPLRAVVLALDSPSTGITKFLMASTDALLAAAEVRRQVLPIPFVRIPLELQAGRADVVTVSYSALEPYRDLVVSVQFLRMPVLLYEFNGPHDNAEQTDAIGIVRGAPLPPALAASAGQLQQVNNYEAMFQMLAARRLAGAVGARPTADLYLQDNPGVAALVKPGPQVDERRMAIHFSRHLPKACLDHLVERVQSRGLAITQQLFTRQYPALNHADYRVPVQVIKP
ncbi:MAG: hypothetical protein E6Q67_07300 [Roseateles sp.]|nr:MAG: hypothetical protein E6Q67_07300 [Roseateles sp.]